MREMAKYSREFWWERKQNIGGIIRFWLQAQHEIARIPAAKDKQEDTPTHGISSLHYYNYGKWWKNNPILRIADKKVNDQSDGKRSQ